MGKKRSGIIAIILAIVFLLTGCDSKYSRVMGQTNDGNVAIPIFTKYDSEAISKVPSDGEVGKNSKILRQLFISKWGEKINPFFAFMGPRRYRGLTLGIGSKLIKDPWIYTITINYCTGLGGDEKSFTRDILSLIDGGQWVGDDRKFREKLVEIASDISEARPDLPLVALRIGEEWSKGAPEAVVFLSQYFIPEEGKDNMVGFYPVEVIFYREFVNEELWEKLSEKDKQEIPVFIRFVFQDIKTHDSRKMVIATYVCRAREWVNSIDVGLLPNTVEHGNIDTVVEKEFSQQE